MSPDWLGWPAPPEQAREVEMSGPSHALKDKAPPSGHSLADVLRKAEDKLADLVDDYLEWAREDAERIDAACRELEASPGARPLRDALYRIAHDMKGQGGTFGYPLVSMIGDSLCKLLERAPVLDRAVVAAARLHVDALRSVIAQRVIGDGGEAGVELVAGLAKVAAKASGGR